MSSKTLILLLGIVICNVSCKPARKDAADADIVTLMFKFDCKDKPVGFYADLQYNCQIFHMCDEKKRRFPHACPRDTSFNQELRICDWEYNVNCSEAPKWYHLNEFTYKIEDEMELECTKT